LKETEKAIMVQMAYDIEVAPDFGYSSSMVKNKVGTLQVWIPKSQIKDGKITDWIAQNKKQEAEDFVMKKFINAKTTYSSVHFLDKDNKPISIDTSAKESAMAKGLQKHNNLLAEAKELGIKGAKINMKTSTIQKLINDMKNGTLKEISKVSYPKSATKIAIGSTVTGKYGTGTIEKIITKSSGYVQVHYANGKTAKEMAFNLFGEDGLALKHKPAKK
jgi:hypothetical protein